MNEGICISCDHFVYLVTTVSSLSGIYEVTKECKKDADTKVPFVYKCKDYANKRAPVHMTMPEIEEMLEDLKKRVENIEKGFRLHERGYVHVNEANKAD